MLGVFVDVCRSKNPCKAACLRTHCRGNITVAWRATIFGAMLGLTRRSKGTSPILSRDPSFYKTSSFPRKTAGFRKEWWRRMGKQPFEKGFPWFCGNTTAFSASLSRPPGVVPQPPSSHPAGAAAAGRAMRLNLAVGKARR